MVRSLPHGTVETFTQSVQPVLMNHCAAGGCHGPQSDTGLRLFRVPTGKLASRRITQRNLYSVLPFVDRENPAGSRLLTAPNGPHGTAKQAIFNEHQAAQYKRMVDWAASLAQQSTPESPATLDARGALRAGRPRLRRRRYRKRPERPVRCPSAGKASRPDARAARNAGQTGCRPPPASFDQPADPFDPEVFNRRYATEKKQATTGE